MDRIPSNIIIETIAKKFSLYTTRNDVPDHPVNDCTPPRESVFPESVFPEWQHTNFPTGIIDHNAPPVTNCRNASAGSQLADAADPTSCTADERCIDYRAIAFFCNLDTAKVTQMHQSPDAYTMGYCVARAMAEAFGITAKQALGFEKINTSEPDVKTGGQTRLISVDLAEKEVSSKERQETCNADGKVGKMIG